MPHPSRPHLGKTDSTCACPESTPVGATQWSECTRYQSAGKLNRSADSILTSQPLPLKFASIIIGIMLSWPRCDIASVHNESCEPTFQCHSQHNRAEHVTRTARLESTVGAALVTCAQARISCTCSETIRREEARTSLCKGSTPHNTLPPRLLECK
jgi:hypothetical protein